MWFHWWFLTYGYLYNLGLWRFVLGSVVALLIGWIMRLGHRLRRIEHLLDTDKPGGLTDVIQAINNDQVVDDHGEVH